MHQVILTEPGRFVSAEADEPDMPMGHARVRVRRIGVCGTDLHAFAGRQPFFTYPRILGHELGVEVVDVSPNDHGIRTGDRCAIEPYLTCGVCRTCRQGRYNCCVELRCLGVHCDGGMRDFFAVPIVKLYRSDRLTFDQLALVETLGIGQHAVERAAVQPEESILVVGAGPIGLAVVQFAAARGARVTVLELSDTRRSFAERFGVVCTVDTETALFDVVFDATGNRTAMAQSLERVAFGGKLVFVGLVQGHVTIDDPMLHRREVTLLASRNSAGAFPEIIRQIEDGTIDTRPWITHRFGLTEVPDAFPRLTSQPGLIKAMIET